jgi:hypothetical protein
MNIISFSLWGSDPTYCIGATKNAELASIIYPGWITRFYCGNNTDIKCINDLTKIPNTEVYLYNKKGEWYSMFWRFFAADGDDIVISRDTDSRLNERERDAVNSWLNSEYDFHIMRDHPWHNYKILGGMWGARNGILKGIVNKINEYIKTDKFINDYNVDQNFLRDYIYPLVKEKAIIHDPFFDNLPFPTKRIGRQFVGQPFNADDTERDLTHGNMIIASKKK